MIDNPNILMTVIAVLLCVISALLTLILLALPRGARVARNAWMISFGGVKIFAFFAIVMIALVLLMDPLMALLANLTT